ncbi:hypothetical protein RJ55_08511 [Drechmeria coniospora]|nr:hypothetical protein RJ55_08511 [Drechmeria coniospora]
MVRLAAALVVAVTASTSALTLNPRHYYDNNMINRGNNINCPNRIAMSYQPPVAAPGWQYRIAANGMRKPRSIVFDNRGGLLVIDVGVGILRLTIRNDWGTDCVVMSEPRRIISCPELSHGIALSHDGRTLYASSPNEVFSWAYDPETGNIIGPRRTVVAALSPTDKTTRTLLSSHRMPGTLVFSRGGIYGSGNNYPSAYDTASGDAQIRALDLSFRRGDGMPHDFRDGDVLGWGLRNPIGVAEHPNTGGIWSVESSVDDLVGGGTYGGRLNYHGVLGDGRPVAPRDGNIAPQPCYGRGDAARIPYEASIRTATQFPGLYGTRTLSDGPCNSRYLGPRLAFAPLSAPLDIKFNRDGSSAFVSFYGTGNRWTPSGYRIAAIPFNKHTGEPLASRDGPSAAVDILSTPSHGYRPERCFRPVGLAWDSWGRLWASSDTTGEIFVLHYSGIGSDSTRSVAADKAAVWAVSLAAFVAAIFLA